MAVCKLCGKLTLNNTNIYCSNKCQQHNQYLLYIKKWKAGSVSGSRGINTKNISRHLIRYLINKYGGKCSICGWMGINPITNRVPLEIDHIDGDSENNKEENLRLLCPNCHSLTPNFRNLNIGNGRVWRQKKYLKNTI